MLELELVLFDFLTVSNVVIKSKLYLIKKNSWNALLIMMFVFLMSNLVLFKLASILENSYLNYIYGAVIVAIILLVMTLHGWVRTHRLLINSKNHDKTDLLKPTLGEIRSQNRYLMHLMLILFFEYFFVLCSEYLSNNGSIEVMAYLASSFTLAIAFIVLMVVRVRSLRSV